MTPNIVFGNGAALATALRRMSIATGKLPADLANRAAMSIAIHARKNMPTATAGDIWKSMKGYQVAVDSYTRKGKHRRTKSKAFFDARGPDAPLLALVIQRRANPAYSGPYKLNESPWKGKTRAAGAEAMLDTMRRVFSKRLAARGFFRLEASVVAEVFRRYVPTKDGKFRISPDRVFSRRGKIADGTPAKGKTDPAVASFWVRSTVPDAKANKGKLESVAAPIWREAFQYENGFVLRKAAEAEYKANIKGAGIAVT